MPDITQKKDTLPTLRLNQFDAYCEGEALFRKISDTHYVRDLAGVKNG